MMYKLRQFLYGRYITYGNDLLSKVLIFTCLGLAILNLFLRIVFIQIIEYALIIFFIYRLFSKNIVKRQSENAKLLKFFHKLKGKKEFAKRKYSEKETHIYKTCPHCSVTLRLKRIKGEHNVICPRCKNSFKVTVKR